jgi:Tfp pilus assembly protein PilO
MMPLSVKTLDRMCLTAVVLVTIVCGYVVTSWGFKQQKLIQQENAILSKKLKDLNLAETNLQRLKTILNSTQKELEILNERIPDSTKIGGFLKQVDALMERKEVDLISIHPQAIVEEKNCNRIPIRLIFEGSFVKVYQILYELETMNRTVVMGKMQIAKSTDTKICRVDLTANIFQRY